MTHLLIVGASRGLGAAFHAGLPEPGDTVWLVSRTEPEGLRKDDGIKHIWIQADLSSSDATRKIAGALSGRRIDVLIYNAGIWESNAFGDDYDFEEVDDAETQNIIAVNLASAITCIQKLIPSLRQSENGKVILIGSVSGMENTRLREVAYNASKFGLRGVAHALRENLRRDRISVTCINPGDIATAIPYNDGVEKAMAAYDGAAIPVHDLVSIVKCVMGLSRATCVKEIDVPAMMDLYA